MEEIKEIEDLNIPELEELQEKKEKPKRKKKGKPKKKREEVEYNPFKVDAEIIVNTLNQVKLAKKGQHLNQSYVAMFMQSYTQVMEKYNISTSTKPELALIISAGLLVNDAITTEDRREIITKVKIKLYNAYQKIRSLFKRKKNGQ